MQHDHVLKKLNFDLMTSSPGSRGRGWGGGWMRGRSTGKIFATKLLHSWFPLNLICNITLFWKSWVLTFSPHGQRVRGVFGKTICYHVAAFVIPFDWICNMSMFWKVEFWSFDLISRVGWGSGSAAGKIFATMLLHLWFHLICYATWPCSEKLNLELLTPPPSPPWGSDPGLWSKITFVYNLLYLCLHAKFQ